MEDAQSSLKQDIEDLVNKTIDANKIFMKDGTNLLKQIVTNKGKGSTINFFQNDFLSKALNAYASLNIQYAKNLIDLGVSLTKFVNQPHPENMPNNNSANRDPVFILQAVGKAGETIKLGFVLDNSKNEDATCELINSDYIFQERASELKVFDTVFNPQSFQLSSGESKSVEIQITIPPKTNPGLYVSKVQVNGFEPAFFTIDVTVC